MIGIVSNNIDEARDLAKAMLVLGVASKIFSSIENITVSEINQSEVSILIALMESEKDLPIVYEIEGQCDAIIFAQEINNDRYKKTAKKVWFKKIIKRAGVSLDQLRNQSAHERDSIKKHQRESDESISSIWIIGASTGSPNIVKNEIISGITLPLKGVIIIVIHIGSFLNKYVEDIAKKNPKLTVKMATDGQKINDGDIIFCPHAKTIIFDETNRICIREIPSQYTNSPSIDSIVKNTLARFKEKTNILVLSGIDNDGTKGAKEIVKANGDVWVQDPETALATEMPLSTIKAVKQAKLLTPKEMPLSFKEKLGTLT